MKVTEAEARHIASTLYRYESVAKGRFRDPEAITDEAIEFYKQEGYMAIERLFGLDEVQAAIGALDDIIQGRIAGPSLQWIKPKEGLTEEERRDAVRKINDYADYSPDLKAIVGKPAMLRVIERIFGEPSNHVLNQALLKPPGAGGEKPWHQDMAYGNQNFDKQTLTVWIALHEATVDNGCMHIIPRSHLKGGTPHYAVRDWQICDRDVDVASDSIVPLAPGGALLFSGLLHHGTPANFTNRRRWALQLRFAPVSARLMSKEAFKLMFTNELIGVDC